ncbi:hypothetical protein LDENG_00030980 [Lucifuga dentata]|nr:hypothetical protein LDENG_00030980 [Lucifuga dentata]
MEVSMEAKRIMVVALGKLYSSRTQRGGLRLHRSLLLTLVMKSARDIYHAAQTTVESMAVECVQQPSPAETSTDMAHLEQEGPQSPVTIQSGTSRREVGVETSAECCGPQGVEDKENLSPVIPARHSRKRRGKVAVEPDFLPCKKAKLEQLKGPQQLALNSVFLVNCSSELAAQSNPVPVHRAVAAC